MKQKVLTFTCDRCEATENLDQLDGNHSLPPNWLALTGRVDNSYAFELDLCPKCAARVLRSLEKELK